MSFNEDCFSFVVFGEKMNTLKETEPLVIGMPLGKRYSIQLINHHENLTSHARVFIDGKQKSSVKLEPSSVQTVFRSIYGQDNSHVNYSNEPEKGILRVEFDLLSRGSSRCNCIKSADPRYNYCRCRQIEFTSVISKTTIRVMMVAEEKTNETL